MKHLERALAAVRHRCHYRTTCASMVVVFVVMGCLSAAAQQNYITVDFEQPRDFGGTVTYSQQNGYSTGGAFIQSQVIHSKGVTLSGGFPLQNDDLHNTDYVSWNNCNCSSIVQLTFPPYATDISLDVDGFAWYSLYPLGPSLYAPLIVDNNGTVVTTVGSPFETLTWHTVTIGQPQGPITIRAPRTGNNLYRINVDNIRFRLQPPTPPVFQFEYGEGNPAERVLLHKYLASDQSGPFKNGYFSVYQVRNVPANQPPQFRIPGVVTQNGAPVVTTVYFRVLDPPDPAPYAQPATTNDNRDRTAGRLFYVDSSGQRVNAQNGTLAVTADQDGVAGRVQLYLETSDHVAGENYQVEASLDPGFPCATAGAGGADTCPKSVMINTWKRIYVEEEHMFRRGAFLSRVFEAGTSQIPVVDTAPFAGLAPGAILQLVHADTGAGEGFYSELVSFKSVGTDPVLGPIIAIDPAYGLPQRDFGGEPSSTHPSPYEQIRRDGVGIVAADLYDSQNAYIGDLFESMYVDVAPAPTTQVEIPHVDEIAYTEAIYLASRWFQNATVINPWRKRATPNLLHRLAVSQAPLVLDAATQRYGAELGITSVGGGSNYSLILAQRIADLTAGTVVDATGNHVGTEYAGLSYFRAEGEVAAHETVHFWVHSGGADSNGHCAFERYQHDGLNCLMHTPYRGIGLADGIVDLHYERTGTTVDSEYETIRTAAEPVPQQ